MSAASGRDFEQVTKGIVQRLKGRAYAKRSRAEGMADRMTATFGSMGFLTANVAWFAAWIVINLNWIPAIPAFDPFPFGLLTMIVSLEAIILAIVVLISQNREARVAELREEMDLQIDVITEAEITRVLQLLTLLLDKHKVEYAKDGDLEKMLRPTDPEKLERSLGEDGKDG